MKIEGLYIDGFGHFHNARLNSFSPHLTVIVGPNEAGKSTLLEFIRRMFFGFKKKGSNPYPPLNGGKHGGRLRLATPEGETVVLERSGRQTDPSLLLTDGNPADCSLTALIGTADQDFFENVYAFGLRELSDFKSLSAGSIQNRVMSAGIGITRGSIADVQAEIQKDRESLFKSGRAWKNIRIKGIFREIENQEKSLRQCTGTQEEYDRLQYELERTKDTLETLKEKDRGVRARLQDASAMLSVWDEWVTYTEIQRHLSTLPEVAAVPEDGVQTLRVLNEKAGEIREELTACRHKLQQATEKLAECLFDEAVCAHADEVRDLENGLKKYLADLAQYEKEVQETKALAEEIETLSQEAGLDDEGLRTFDLSANARQKIEEFRARFADLDEQARSMRSENERLEHEIKEAQGEIQKDQAALSSIPSTSTTDEIHRKRSALDELSVKIPAWSKAKDDLDHLIEKEAEIGTRLKHEELSQGVTLPRWPAFIFVAAGVVVLAGGAAMGSFVVGGGLFLLMIVCAGLYLKGIGKETPAEITVGEDVLDMASVRQKKEHALAEQEDTLRKKAHACGFSTIPDLTAINTQRSGLQQEMQHLLERDGLEKTLKASLKVCAERTTDLEKVQVAATLAKEEREETTARWQAWVRSVSLDETLTPAVVLETVPSVQQAQDRMRAREAAEKRGVGLKEAIAAYEEAVARTVPALGIEPDTPVKVQVQHAVAALDDHLTRRSQHELLEQECAGKRDDEKVLIKRLEDVNRSRDELFSQASVEDEETFQEHARIWEKRNKLLDEKATAELQLKKAAGGARDFPAYLKRLESTERLDLQEAVRTCEQDLEEITPAVEEHLQAVGRLKNEIGEIEEDIRATTYETKLRRLDDDLTEASHAWAVRVIAGHLLHQAIEKYEKERQPAVIQEATRYFSGITEGRYQKIIRPIDAETLTVEEGDGTRKDLTDLSLGTAQQLYLALRFGYITEFGKHDAALPAVFDDVLVNFDPARKKRGCQAIADLAEKTQVLYFTCHPETVDLLTEAQPDAQVIRLEGVEAK